jgi:hypothetical protein
MTLLVQPMLSAAPLGLRERTADKTPVSCFLAAIRRGIDWTRQAPVRNGPSEPIRKDAYREI